MITFDEESHIYRVGGEIKQSVTQMLKAAGIVNYDGLDPYYADRGTRVHDACTLYAQGWPYKEEDDTKVYVDNFKALVGSLKLSYVSAEEVCYDPEYDICGTYDLIMLWKKKRVLIELKTTDFKMHHGLQLASYERMVNVDDVMGIALKESKVYVKGEDWLKNHEVLKDIHSGWFVHEEWVKDRGRRRMKILK